MLLMMVVALRLMLFSAMMYKVGLISWSIHRSVVDKSAMDTRMMDMVLFGDDMAR